MLDDVEEIRVTTADLLEAWREATRAAELAARIAREAEKAADQADVDALASTEIAELAEKAAEAATAAALKARAAADRANGLAAARRSPGVGDARLREEAAIHAESEARDRYHEGEEEARRVAGEQSATNL